MSYKFREVKCPECEHIFMWNKDGEERLAIYEYRIKATGERVEKAKCPCCGKYMLVMEHVLLGIEVDDERFEKIGIRGI